MPITWRLRRDHSRGGNFSSDANFIALSGQMEIGSASRDVLSDQSTRFAWFITVVNTNPVKGWCDTIEEAKAALERAWFDWVAKAGLRDDP